MKDILGRELKNDDLIVGKGNGDGLMKIGKVCDDKFIFLFTNDESKTYKTNIRDVFKIVNPTKEELNISHKIDKITKQKLISKNPIKKEYFDYKSITTGQICKTNNDDMFLFLGYSMMVNVEILEKHDTKFRQYCNVGRYNENPCVGYCYLHINPHEYRALKDNPSYISLLLNKIINDGNSNMHSLTVMKHHKKFICQTDVNIDLKFPIVLEKEIGLFTDDVGSIVRLTIE